MNKLISLIGLCVLIMLYACEQTELIPVSQLESSGTIHSRAIETYKLYGGQDIEAGTVTVETTETDLIVTYETTDGWELGTTHLYVGSAEGLPISNEGNPKIGQFPYAQELGEDELTNVVVYTIPLSDIETTEVEDTTLSGICTYLKGNCETTSWEAFFPINPDDVFCATIDEGGTNDESITWASGDGLFWSEVDCGVQSLGKTYPGIIEEVMKSQGVNALGGSYTVEVVDTDGDSRNDAVRVQYVGCYLGELFITSNCYDHPDGYITECNGAQRTVVAPDGRRIGLNVGDTENVTNTAPWVFQFAPEAMETVETRAARQNEAGEWIDTETGEVIPDVAIDCSNPLSNIQSCFVIAPHAELFKTVMGTDTTTTQGETGWAEWTTEFEGNRWGGYNEFCFSDNSLLSGTNRPVDNGTRQSDDDSDDDTSESDDDTDESDDDSDDDTSESDDDSDDDSDDSDDDSDDDTDESDDDSDDDTDESDDDSDDDTDESDDDSDDDTDESDDDSDDDTDESDDDSDDDGN